MFRYQRGKCQGNEQNIHDHIFWHPFLSRYFIFSVNVFIQMYLLCGYFAAVGNGNRTKGGSQTHWFVPWRQPWTRHCYRQHCAQRKAPVFNLLRGRFWGFSPRRDETLHRWGWNTPIGATPIGATVRAQDPQNWYFYWDLIRMCNINAPQGRTPCESFTKFAEFVPRFRCVIDVRISLDLLRELRSYGGFKLMVSGFCQIFSTP